MWVEPHWWSYLLWLVPWSHVPGPPLRLARRVEILDLVPFLGFVQSFLVSTGCTETHNSWPLHGSVVLLFLKTFAVVVCLKNRCDGHLYGERSGQEKELGWYLHLWWTGWLCSCSSQSSCFFALVEQICGVNLSRRYQKLQSLFNCQTITFTVLELKLWTALCAYLCGWHLTFFLGRFWIA